MCEQCGEIDGKIARYRRIMMSIGDEVTIERFKEVIADLEAQSSLCILSKSNSEPASACAGTRELSSAAIWLRSSPARTRSLLPGKPAAQ